MYKEDLPRLTDTQLQTQITTNAKKTPERKWLAEVSSDALVQAMGDLRAANKNFFDSKKGKWKNGHKIYPPRKKKKTVTASARFTRNGFVLRPNGKLYLTKIGNIKIRWSRPLPAAPSSVTLLRDSSGRYFVSFVVDVPNTPLPFNSSEIGIDLGLSSYAIDSNGNKIETPKFFRRMERKIRRMQRLQSRRYAEGARQQSNNYIKARMRTAKIHAKIKDQRHNFIHQITTRIIRDNQAIYVENLAVKNMMKKFGKSISDQSLGMFIRVLELKCKRYGRTFIKIGCYFPSTQKCSICDSLTGPKGLAGLKIRTWTCSACGTTHDRDINAAINILAEGRRLASELGADSLNACGADVRPSQKKAVCEETGTHRSTASHAVQ
jgi:putative transposase